MAIRIKFDNTNNIIQPTFILAKRNGNKLGVIEATNIQIADRFNSNSEVSFTIEKYNNGIKNILWDSIEEFKLIYCKEYNTWFEIHVEKNDDNSTVKNILGISLGEAELSQIMLYGIEINTEDDISQENYIPTVLFDDNPKASLLNRIMEKAPHYSIGYVSPSIRSIQRTFTFDGTSLLDAFNEISNEINCIFVIDSGMSENGKPKREINVYDLESYCVACGHREEFLGNCPKCGSSNVLPGYGEDTSIFISKDNLADNISYSTDKDSVKNCFRLEAGDDLMTAAIINCNPNGSQYIWYLSNELKNDMSDSLQEKLTEYDDLYLYYANEYTPSINADVISNYNELIQKYHPINNSLTTINNNIVGYSELMNAYYNTIDMYLFLHDSMMPSVESSRTTAALQAARLGHNTMSPVAVADITKASTSTVNNIVLSIARTIINPSYQVKINEGIYSEGVWTGNFRVTNYSDEEDTAISVRFNININDNQQLSVEQKIKKVLSEDSDEVTSITDLFALPLSEFQIELQKYNLSSLSSFEKSCQACLNILIENGASVDDAWTTYEVDMYKLLYVPYHDKLLAIQAEILVRESEIEIIIGKTNADGERIVVGLQNAILDENYNIQNALNFQSFLGDELWLEFSAYRRDDTYQNDNYISDGLDNKELFDKAHEFFETAKKEIYKSATLQHSISASLKNLLVMQEFQPIVDYFQVGNWLRIKIDDNIYRLRLLSYQINYEELDSLSVEFSDVQRIAGGMSDIESILSQASSMASSYGGVTRQSKQGKKGNEQLRDWVDKGLSLTKVKIIDNANNQNVTWDEFGLLCRRMDEYSGEYDPQQIKIINKGLYITDDNWRTSKAGIGAFTFYNPETQQVEDAYGVIADTLVGNLILSEKVGIYNTQNSIIMDENGLTITTDATNGVNNTALTVQKYEYDANNNKKITQVMYLDEEGNLVLTGSLRIQSGRDDSVDTLGDLCDIERLQTKISKLISDESSTIYSEVDKKYGGIYKQAQDYMDAYKTQVGQYLDFTSNTGLTIGAKTSNFKTVIDNQGMWFKDGNTTVAYVNNEMLNIPNAVIEQSLILGKFFFNPRNDGGVSLIWQG